MWGVNILLNEEYDEFTESEVMAEKVNDDLYNEAVEMYTEYINITYDLYENYDGELSEEELMELEYINNRYGNLKEDLAEELAEKLTEEIIDTFMDALSDF